MIRKILIIVGCVFLFLATLYVFIFVMFPTGYVRHLAEKKLETALKQEQTVEIKELKISPFLNVRLRDVSMTPRYDENDAFVGEGGEFNGYYCAPAVESMPFVIKDIFVNPKVLKSLRGIPEGAFNIQFDSGSVDGNLKTRNQVMEVKAQGDAIDLNAFALLSNLTHMQLYGTLGFDVRAVVEKNKLAELHLSMNAANAVLCPKRLNLNLSSLPYFDLPFTAFGDIHADIEITKDNKLIINSLTTTGPDLVLTVTGDIKLKSKDTPNPRLNLHAEIQPSSEWVTANNMKVIYQICEKHDDGSISLDLSGTTKKLKHDCGTPIPEFVEPVKKVASPEVAKSDRESSTQPSKDADNKAKKEDEPPPPELESPDASPNPPEPPRANKSRKFASKDLHAPNAETPKRMGDGSHFKADRGRPRSRAEKSDPPSQRRRLDERPERTFIQDDVQRGIDEDISNRRIRGGNDLPPDDPSQRGLQRRP